MVTIKNEYLTAQFKEVGAELKRLTDGKTDYIWQGDEKYWAGSCPNLFPICSGLINDQYTLGGKTYELKKHGFARFCEFQVEEKKENEVTFLLTANEETLKQYPYQFELRIIYKLEGKKLVCKFNVRNAENKEMYFSVGSHEGYNCPEGIEEYDIILAEKQDLVSTTLTGPNTLGFEELQVLKDSNVFPLSYDWFKVDALVFMDYKGEYVTLKNRKTGKEVRVTFNDAPYLLLWTKPGAPYICIEPWYGLADRDGSNGIFETKQGIQHINAGEVFEKEHVIEVIK